MIDLDTTTRRYLRVDEVQVLFDVSRRTVYNWISTGKLRATKIDQTTRVEVEDLRRRMQAVQARIHGPSYSRKFLHASCQTARIS